MTRLHRRRHNPSGWTDRHRAALIGHDFFRAFEADRGMGPFTDRPGDVQYRIREDHAARIIERKRAAWNDLREELLDTWIAERPFSRPRAWWDFDAPERRRCINTLHPFDDPQRIAYCQQLEAEYPGYTQETRRLHLGIPGALVAPDFVREPQPEYETERDYLIRLDLMTDHERELLAQETNPASVAPAAAANNPAQEPS